MVSETLIMYETKKKKEAKPVGSHYLLNGHKSMKQAQVGVCVGKFSAALHSAGPGQGGKEFV